MDFLENLYNIENFGLYLFLVIGVLILLFLIVLFFGKKDQKKRKLEETKQLENTLEEEATPFKEVSEPIPVEPKVEEAVNSPKLEEPIPAPMPVTSSENIFTAMPNEALMEEPKVASPIMPEEKPQVLEEPPKIIENEPKSPQEEKEFDFDALAEAISKELDGLEEKKEPKMEKPILEKQEEAPLHYQVFEPYEEPKEVLKTPIFEPKEEPKINTVKEEPPKVKPVMPPVFSSVYVNREKEEKNIVPPVEEVKPQNKEQEPSISIPVTPKIELPKMMDLPKKK